MDLSIWDSPENQDESSYPANSWKYNLYFDPRLDVIEEDALNEKSCLQVLKIQISKADSEIIELEHEILMLQRQLACEVNMDIAALEKRIVKMESMLKALNNENQQVCDGSSKSSAFLEDPTRPAESGVGSSNPPEGHNNEVVSPMSSITPPPSPASINNMPMVRLKALAKKYNIHGVSKTRKAELQQVLCSKLHGQDRS